MTDTRKTASTAYENATSMSVRDDDDNYTHAVYDNDTGEIHHLDSNIGGRDYSWGYDEGDQGWTDDSGGSSSSCYIATATTLGNPDALRILETLKEWRRSVLEQTPLGLELSNYYRRTAPRLASRLPGHPVVAKSIRLLFVMPATRLIKIDPTNKGIRSLRDLTVGAIFVAGLCYGWFLRRIVK